MGDSVCFGGLRSAARRIFVVAFFGFGDDEIRLPTSAVGIGRPHFVLDRVAARLIHLDVDGVACGSETRDRGVDVFRFLDHNTVVRAFAHLRREIDVNCELEPRIVGKKQGVTVYSRAKASNAEIIVEPHVNQQAQWREFTLRDPDGYSVAIVEP